MKNLLQTNQQAGQANKKTFLFEMLLKGNAKSPNGKKPSIQFADFFGAKTFGEKLPVKTSNIVQVINLQKEAKQVKNNVLVNTESKIPETKVNNSIAKIQGAVEKNTLKAKVKIQLQKSDITNPAQDVEADIVTSNVKTNDKAIKNTNLKTDLVGLTKKEIIVKSESKTNNEFGAAGKVNTKNAVQSEKTQIINNINITGLKSTKNISDKANNKIDNTNIAAMAKIAKRTEKILVTNLNKNSKIGINKTVLTDANKLSATSKKINKNTDGKTVKSEFNNQGNLAAKSSQALKNSTEVKIETATNKKDGFTFKANQNNLTANSTSNLKNENSTKIGSQKNIKAVSNPELTTKTKHENPALKTNQTATTKNELKPEVSNTHQLKANPVLSADVNKIESNSQQAETKENTKNVSNKSEVKQSEVSGKHSTENVVTAAQKPQADKAKDSENTQFNNIKQSNKIKDSEVLTSKKSSPINNAIKNSSQNTVQNQITEQPVGQKKVQLNNYKKASQTDNTKNESQNTQQFLSNEKVGENENVDKVKRTDASTGIKNADFSDKFVSGKVSEKSYEAPIKTDESNTKQVKPNNFNTANEQINSANKGIPSKQPVETLETAKVQTEIPVNTTPLSASTANSVVNTFFSTNHSVLAQINQFMEMAKTSKTNVSKFEIDLGQNEKMEIQFTKQGENHSAKILVGSETAFQSLEKIIPELKIQLENKGINFVSLDVEMENFTQENAKNENQDNTNRNQKHGTKMNNSNKQIIDQISATRDFGYNTIEILA